MLLMFSVKTFKAYIELINKIRVFDLKKVDFT